jgi:hypothetical protein
MGLNGLGLDCGLLALFEFAAKFAAGEARIFGFWFDSIEAAVTEAAVATGAGGTILALFVIDTGGFSLVTLLITLLLNPGLFVVEAILDDIEATEAIIGVGGEIDDDDGDADVVLDIPPPALLILAEVVLFFGKLGAVDKGFDGLETDVGEEEEVIGVLVGAVAVGFVAIFEELLTEVACPGPGAELTLLVLLRPRVASALDNDSLLKFRKPLRLFGNGGKPSIFNVYALALLFTTFLASIAYPQPQNFLL